MPAELSSDFFLNQSPGAFLELQRILTCMDATLLDRWLARSWIATTVSDVLDGPG